MKERYHSKAYRAYEARVRFHHFGNPLHALGEALAESLLFTMSRPGFMRTMLATPEEREAERKALENNKRKAEEAKRAREAKLAAFRAELLPYSRHIDYTNKGYNEPATEPVPTGLPVPIPVAHRYS
jgi:hypothetical protein